MPFRWSCTSIRFSNFSLLSPSIFDRLACEFHITWKGLIFLVCWYERMNSYLLSDFLDSISCLSFIFTSSVLTTLISSETKERRLIRTIDIDDFIQHALKKSRLKKSWTQVVELWNLSLKEHLTEVISLILTTRSPCLCFIMVANFPVGSKWLHEHLQFQNPTLWLPCLGHFSTLKAFWII